MATNHELDLSWIFNFKTTPNQQLLDCMTEGEEILQCYATVRDQAALTNKRLIILDKQGITGKKVEIYSLPYRSIDMWSSENSGVLDLTSELQLWTKAGHFKISLNSKCDIREFDKIFGKAILNA